MDDETPIIYGLEFQVGNFFLKLKPLIINLENYNTNSMLNPNIFKK